MPATSAGTTVERRLGLIGTVLAVKLVHGPVQAIQCNASNGEHASVDGKDHQKNIDAVRHGAPLLTTDTAAGGRRRSRPPSTRGPGWQPPWRRREHPLLPGASTVGPTKRNTGPPLRRSE